MPADGGCGGGGKLFTILYYCFTLLHSTEGTSSLAGTHDTIDRTTSRIVVRAVVVRAEHHTSVDGPP